MMCYSTQPRVSVKDYGYLFFAQNMGKNIDKNVLILAKDWVVITAKNIFIMPNNAPQRLYKLYQRDQFKKKQRKLVIWLVIKLLRKLQKSE